ncbi:MAG: 4-demethylwyosine synthase TYW1 [Candidatus Aenigmarchaeota archaeon]|nr:4-demethylwyosine synthase TYW1 [Candidatus Aenigmarchaeota archaeon]
MKLISEEARKKLLNAGYRIVGSHSTIKICHWTKEVLNKRRFCYKRWYGIKSHRCVQMTPSLICNFSCLHCWRFHGIIPFKELEKWNEPNEIIDGCIKSQRELLSGFGGNPNTPREIFEEAMNPKHFAISLDGEPTLYPQLSQLIGEIKKRNMTAFLVTNGSMPERLEKLEEEPTNLYISVYGPNKEIFEKVSVPLIPNAWERLNKSLELVKSFSCTTVIRLTLIREVNLKDPEEYGKLVLKTEPKFIEVKSFFHVGEAQKRLPRSAMLEMKDIKEFAEKLSHYTSYEIKEEDEASRVILLSR